ncbi:DNA-binding transcriptional regulator YiaG [Azospirillum sp. OGB3]|uniref:helix-turn-helix domain-containing protein n=1 Tax=Azospirillum sp. OGB3 TaxID=2587012 RepID=UPI0016062416|nr:helix-turn-helix domain-containing protein [Azospirillum sp. OGB3]MBB3264065.1 DNA-binding transcriptional regulator YiaG [Azospirillum sp. OGB3]
MTITPYHYTECGLDDVWIEGIELHVDLAGKAVYRIPNFPGLHREIARSIVCDGVGMTGPELRFLRTELGLTQQELGNILHVEALTISRWERGENPIHQNAMTVIRLLAVERLKLEEIGIERISRQSVSDAKSARVVVDGTDPENYRAQRKVA